MTTTVLAFLFHDAQLSQMCVSCAAKLEAQGMLRVEHELPLPNDTRRLTYELVPPHTLETCRTQMQKEKCDDTGDTTR